MCENKAKINISFHIHSSLPSLEKEGGGSSLFVLVWKRKFPRDGDARRGFLGRSFMPSSFLFFGSAEGGGCFLVGVKRDRKCDSCHNIYDFFCLDFKGARS